jgi:hypothetical protein
MAGRWRRPLNDELYIFCTTPNVIREKRLKRMTWEGHIARLRKMINVYKIFVGKPDGKRPLGRTRFIWEDNIRMGLREIRWKGVDCIHLAQDKAIGGFF